MMLYVCNFGSCCAMFLGTSFKRFMTGKVFRLMNMEKAFTIAAFPTSLKNLPIKDLYKLKKVELNAYLWRKGS